MTKKIAINTCYGGFHLSDAACQLIAEKFPDLVSERIVHDRPYVILDFGDMMIKAAETDLQKSVSKQIASWRKSAHMPKAASNFDEYRLRDHPALIMAVEQLGKEASGPVSDIVLVEVSGPYRITDYDGIESVIEIKCCDRCGQALGDETICVRCGAPQNTNHFSEVE